MDNLSPNQKEFVKYGAGVALGAGVMVCTYRKIKNCMERHHLAKLVKDRQEQRSQKFANLKIHFLMTAETRNITELSFEDLQDQLQLRKLTAVQVLTAFIAKSLVGNAETNCVTEFNPRAMEMAAQLDDRTDVKGPLHGIPFCVKDDTHVAGMDSTVGFARNLNKPADANAVIVQVLEDLGAIPFCRTNLPQSCISFGSHNPIFGKTLNPLNKNLSPGGSSSGTGALIAAGCAPFGIGTDTGGSARVPSHFCGLSTIKSSKNRVSRKGCLFCIDKCVGLVPTPCIMAKLPTHVSTIFQAMMESNLHNQYDGKVLPLSWNQQVFKSPKKLRIGYYTSLAVFPSMGDTAETVLKAKTALETLGHTLVPFEIMESEYYAKILLQLSMADLGSNLAKKLKNDQVSPKIKELYDVGCLPHWKRRFCALLPSWMNYYNPEILQVGLSTEYSMKLWDIMAERRTIIDKLLERMNVEKIDLILCPAWPFPALPVDDINNSTMVAGMYTFIWNLMDFPAGIVKVGEESGNHFDDDYNVNGNFMRKVAKKQIRESIGMPIGVQIVGKPFKEELVLKIMVELHKQIHG